MKRLCLFVSFYYESAGFVNSVLNSVPHRPKMFLRSIFGSQRCEVLSSSFSILTGCCEIYVTAHSGHSCPPLTLRLHCLWVLSKETVFSPCDKCRRPLSLGTQTLLKVQLIYAPEITNSEKDCRQQGQTLEAYVRFLFVLVGSYGTSLFEVSRIVFAL